MNELGSRLDWEMTVKQLRQKHMSLSGRDAAIWEHKMTSAMQKLPYLKSLGKLQDEDDPNVIMLKAVLKEVANNLDAVQKDFRTVLNSYVIGSRTNFVTFSNAGTGFEVHIAMIDEEERLFTGVIKAEAT